MAAAPSPARTRPRSTARRPMPRATSPRTSSPPGSPTAARSSSPTPSASPSRCRSMSTCTAPARSTRPSSKTALRKVMDLSPRGIRKHLDLNKPIYAKTVVLRPFRPQARPRRLLLLGEDRSRQGAEGGRGRLTPGRSTAMTATAAASTEGVLRPPPRQDHAPAAGGALDGRAAGATGSTSAQPAPADLRDAVSASGLATSASRSASAAASICCHEAASASGNRLHRRRALRQSAWRR